MVQLLGWNSICPTLRCPHQPTQLPSLITNLSHGRTAFPTIFKNGQLVLQGAPLAWHRSSLEAAVVVTAYIEIISSHTVKYEVDKPSGHLKSGLLQKLSKHRSKHFMALFQRPIARKRSGSFAWIRRGARASLAMATHSTSCADRA